MDPVKEPKSANLYVDNAAFQNGYGGLYPDLSKPIGQPSVKPRTHLPTDNASRQQKPAEITEESGPSMPPERPPKPRIKSKKVKPIKVESLSEYNAKQKANNSEGFGLEFDDIPSGQEYPWEESLKEPNRVKSRYQNIYPYDHSRILLETLEGVPNSDYINASLVKGYKDKPYIAAQGPSKGSMGDIWRMAWEQKSAKIVMLTNLVEQGKRKCQQYWPETNEPFVATPMKVRRKKIREYADFVIRDFVLEKDGEDKPHEIRQFHFVSWPDMGVPEYPTQILNFIRLVNAYEPEESGLPILHCSAGVGRTGTFITIAGMLEMAAAEGKIDVNGTVRKLRKDRISMVQTKEQYEFIFDTVQEAVMCGDTGILITNLRQSFIDLQNPVNKKTGNTKLENQFKILENLTVVPPANECKSGYASENVDKNRFRDRVPKDKGRPYLRTTLINGGTDYINAAFIDGYVRKKEFIATQMPLTNTIEDFWTMVYEFNTTSIVMLNRMSQSDPSFGMYWIESGTMPMTSFTVEFQSSTNYMDEVTGRTFKVYPNDSPQSAISVQQFQLHNWPLGQDTPDSVAPLIAMIDTMEKWQNKQPKTSRGKPIVVHCTDGIEASGVFCALVIMLNKMKAEKVVDVFQSVKRLRMGRPGMVQTLDQYKFLYEAAQVSLDEFKTYENFR
ncbi:receptor-type tyrosine-protein phosphatase mu-like [Amphiura filiformis]|uniref:receptor-type tyrosine-protein phosphatase mu-like n=1 Tax=Amphiura filiformis TaxID=82378 RepID=UPI003B2273C3